jgi:signal transduction histidine kinase/DNA-binding response OmpR family regulator
MDPKASILIVDDRPEKVLALEAVLEDLNQNIVVAYSGREALRHLLKQEFAVILLDVNMPGMDGFETAGLIRQRMNSRHTPIIFITAFGDEMHAARGYSLGAVDYILAPVLPEVLRTKVSVFVDLFVKTQQIQGQAQSLQRRAAQMQKLAAASLAINSALSIHGMLQTIADSARDIIGSHQAIVLHFAANLQGKTSTQAATSFSEKYTPWRDRELPGETIAKSLVFQNRSVMRMSDAEIRRHPGWVSLSGLEIPPIHGGILAAPLSGRDGEPLGVIYLSDRDDGDFSADDEAVLVQLAQMGSIALENTVYAQERQVNRIKDEFLATLSHELRTPLNAILGWIQLLRIDNVEGELGHGLEVIERNARAQTKLIEDLLDVSRIATGKMRLNLTRSAMGPLIQTAIDTARPAAEAKSISLESEIPSELVSISVDPDRILQVVGNILSNAIKFTPQGGSVRLELSESTSPSHAIKLQISDTGQGIDPKFLPYVFDRFRQADSASTRRHGGLGIGLALVRHVVEQHGGSVTAHSRGQGLGATFTIELPVNPQEPAAIAPAKLVQTKTNHANIAGLRVLIVDDEPDARDLIATTLRSAGGIVRTADSVSEALDILRDFPQHALVSDIAMPEQDGYMLIRQIRQSPEPEMRNLPAVALTAYAREEDRLRALSAGFQAHLVKPVDPDGILSCISQLADRAKDEPERSISNEPQPATAVG